MIVYVIGSYKTPKFVALIIYYILNGLFPEYRMEKAINYNGASIIQRSGSQIDTEIQSSVILELERQQTRLENGWILLCVSFCPLHLS